MLRFPIAAIAATFASLASCSDPADSEPPRTRQVDWVNPFIGTGGDGYRSPNCFPGAVAPFGMVQVSPDTRSLTPPGPHNHAAGYHFDDELLLGFSHNRLQGISSPELNAVLLLPANGEPSELVIPSQRIFTIEKE